MKPFCARARVRKLFLCVTVVALACGCGTGSTTGTGNPGDTGDAGNVEDVGDTGDAGVARAVAALEVVSGNTQTGVAGEELADPVVVLVKDDKGHPVPEQIINFVVLTGGGRVFAGAALSDKNGMAQERWTLGPVAGPQRLEARAVDTKTGTPIVFASFDATAVPGPAVAVRPRKQIKVANGVWSCYNRGV